MPPKTGKSTSAGSNTVDDAQSDERDQAKSASIALPAHVAGSGTLDRLVETARNYAKQATSENTLKAYRADWAHFSRWCRMIEPRVVAGRCPMSARWGRVRLGGRPRPFQHRAVGLFEAELPVQLVRVRGVQ